MPRIDFFAARSPGGAEMLRRWGARSEIGIVPHTIPEWEPPERPRAKHDPFTIGFAGRLVEAKGIHDLLRAVRRLDFPFRLLVVGDGPLRAEFLGADLGRGELELRTGVRSAEMPALYARMDLLVLPSRTTETWAEQFGKVLCEALLCGTPVLGSSSGEIPWVIESSAGDESSRRAAWRRWPPRSASCAPTRRSGSGSPSGGGWVSSGTSPRPSRPASSTGCWGERSTGSGGVGFEPTKDPAAIGGLGGSAGVCGSDVGERPLRGQGAPERASSASRFSTRSLEPGGRIRCW
jgi:hypothetical protein